MVTKLLKSRMSERQKQTRQPLTQEPLVKVFTKTGGTQAQVPSQPGSKMVPYNNALATRLESVSLSGPTNISIYLVYKVKLSSIERVTCPPNY